MDIGEIDDDAHGITTPRIYTPPLRPLTPATSDGYGSSNSPNDSST